MSYLDCLFCCLLSIVLRSSGSITSVGEERADFPAIGYSRSSLLGPSCSKHR